MSSSRSQLELGKLSSRRLAENTQDSQSSDRKKFVALVKKDNETVRHFALNVQQLVEKGWCTEIAPTINLKCDEIFTKGYPKYS